MVEVLCHSSIRIEEGNVIYIDPFKINKDYHDADYIFFTICVICTNSVPVIQVCFDTKFQL